MCFLKVTSWGDSIFLFWVSSWKRWGTSSEGGASERKWSFVPGFPPLSLCLPSHTCRDAEEGFQPASLALLHISFLSPSSPMHLSATPKGRATLTFTLCFLSLSLFSPFAYVVNGGTSQLIRHVYEWHRARGEAGAPCQKWRTSLLHALCLADPICPNTDGHKIGLCGTAGLGSIRRAIFEQSFSHVSPAFQLLQAQWSILHKCTMLS